MKRTVSVAQVATAEQALECGLPPRVQEALGELVGAAQEGLLALSVGVGHQRGGFGLSRGLAVA